MDLAAPYYHFTVPFMARIQRHKLNEPKAHIVFACKTRKIDDLVIVSAANDNGVDLDRVKTDRSRRLDRGEDFIQPIDASDI